MATRKTGQGRESPASPPPLPDRRLMEQQMAAISRILSDNEFASIDEANAYLQETLAGGGSLPIPTPTTPLEKAQEIIYQALEATGKRRQELARRALAISPNCADAYVILAEVAKDAAEARRLYEEGVRAGERALGPEAFDEAVGHFWGVIETRPYMRAREGLAQALWYLDEREAAIAHLQDMLRLNPGDNQGVRYTLANWLLAVGDDEALGKLLKQFPDEWSAQWAYTMALYTFRTRGEGKASDTALQKALDTNPYVPMYLLGAKTPPRQMPGYYGMGDENEAMIYTAEAVRGWLETKGALPWLVAGVARALPVAMGAKKTVGKG